MNYRISIVLCILLLTSGCISYSLVAAGSVTVGNLQVDTVSDWNKAPSATGASLRKGSVMWTRDGPLLDRLVLIPGVPDGEALIWVRKKKYAALPEFRSDMLPNELEELAESTFVKYFGEGNAVVTTENLRPHRFGEHSGILFDVNAAVTDAPDQKGTAGAFVADDRLYMVFFFAATPYYYDKHIESAGDVIKSARLTSK